MDSPADCYAGNDSTPSRPSRPSFDHFPRQIFNFTPSLYHKRAALPIGTSQRHQHSLTFPPHETHQHQPTPSSPPLTLSANTSCPTACLIS
ncbi:hypothetical protein FJTKL_10721 [Diaporthe vaccinii]|uniref:Uncharacterized protein n=1 Tax=Diaporthe vaccinii TaxID=105482 RepID=A0ABR4FBH3_9PEZI